MSTYSRRNIGKIPLSWRVWEWEDGGGISALSHDPEEVAQWIEAYMRDTFDTVLWRDREYREYFEPIEEFLTASHIRDGAVQQWVRAADLDKMEGGPLATFDRWWFGRVPITVIPY